MIYHKNIDFKNRLRQFLGYRKPYAILSWRYLLPGQSVAVRLHKLCFLHAFPGKPRILWLAIALFSYIKWYTFRGGIQLFKTWKKYSLVLQEKTGISRSKQFIGLLKLVFMQTTPPGFYYRYRLYSYTTLEWFNFIYTHELSTWHCVMSPDMSQETTHLLTNKAAFAQEMQKQGFPVIEGIVIRKGDQLSKKQLFQQKTLFLKPLCGSRKIGVYELGYRSSTDSYSLFVDENNTIGRKEEISSFFQSLIDKQDYLIQPLLLNHPELQKLSEYHSLITFRVITVWDKKSAMSISAIAEFPVNDNSEYIYSFPVDLQSGTILEIKEKVVNVKEDIEEKFEHIPGHQVVHWHELVDIVQKAHAFFPDLFSIGWDLAITPEGVRLIEGNINWAVAPHQHNGPALMQYFIKFAKSNVK